MFLVQTTTHLELYVLNILEGGHTGTVENIDVYMKTVKMCTQNYTINSC